jgi:hypothetical protein
MTPVEADQIDARVAQKTKETYESTLFGVGAEPRSLLIDAIVIAAALPISQDSWRHDWLFTKERNARHRLPKIEQCFGGSFDKFYRAAIREFAEKGGIAYEIGLSPEVDRCAVYAFPSESLVSIFGFHWQRRRYWPHSKRRDEYISLRDRRVVRAEIPVVGQRRWGEMSKAMAALGEGQLGSFPNMQSARSYEQYYDIPSQERLSKYALAELCYKIGWLRDFTSSQQLFTPFYVMQRWLRFQIFVARVAEASLSTMNTSLRILGQATDFELSLAVKWPVSRSEYEAALTAWILGDPEPMSCLKTFPRELFANI